MQISAAGTARLPGRIEAAAKQLAADDFARCLVDDFAGDEVRDHAFPGWLRDPWELLPHAALASIGLAVRDRQAVRLYATCTVDSHIDDMDGLSVAVVLHSDGFVFEQLDVQRVLHPGDWFVFDDRLPHEVKEAPSSTTLLVLAAPLCLNASEPGRMRAALFQAAQATGCADGLKRMD